MWELDYKASWALKNWCFWTVVLEKTLESPLDCKEIQPVNPKWILNIHLKEWCWSWNSNTLATWCKELTQWERPWWWERLKAGREGDDRGWDGWMASLMLWAWFWVSSRSWWWAGKLGVLHSMGSQSRTRLSDWVEDFSFKSTPLLFVFYLFHLLFPPLLLFYALLWINLVLGWFRFHLYHWLIS